MTVIDPLDEHPLDSDGKPADEKAATAKPPRRRPPTEDLVDEDAQSLRALRNGSIVAAAASLSQDTVRAYLREIGRVALLTGELEVLCAKRIEAGIAASEQL